MNKTSQPDSRNSAKIGRFQLEKYILWAILSLIILATAAPVLGAFPAISSGMSNPDILEAIEEMNEGSATFSMFLLALTLALSPLLLILSRNFDVQGAVQPGYRALRWFARHKRTWGVFAFVAALVHTIAYFLQRVFEEPTSEEAIATFISDFGQGTYIAGWIAFLIFLLLAITSTNSAVRALGGKKWKNLHRLVYLSIVGIFIHVLLKEDEVEKVVVFLGPLVPLELYRFKVFLEGKKLNKEPNRKTINLIS